MRPWRPHGGPWIGACAMAGWVEGSEVASRHLQRRSRRLNRGRPARRPTGTRRWSRFILSLGHEQAHHVALVPCNWKSTKKCSAQRSGAAADGAVPRNAGGWGMSCHVEARSKGQKQCNEMLNRWSKGLMPSECDLYSWYKYSGGLPCLMRLRYACTAAPAAAAGRCSVAPLAAGSGGSSQCSEANVSTPLMCTASA